MSSRALYVLALASSAACPGRTAPPRDRVLSRIPADSQIVIAADGPALAGPRMRAVVDVLRPRWPTRFGCVIDAALAGDHLAVGITAERDLTVVIASRAAITCPSLSNLGAGLWTATLGAGKPAVTDSVLTGDEHARARSYLRTAPIAVSIALPGVKILAAMSAEPLEGWLAIDTLAVASALAEQKVRGVVDRLARTDATARFAAAIEISHDGPQVIARLTGPVDADLSLAARTIVDWYTASAVRSAVGFACPPLGPLIVACSNGTSLGVSSLGAALAPLVEAPVAAIIENERVAWLRLDAAVPTLGLRRGDLLLAVDGRRLTSAAQLAGQLRGARQRASIMIQRDAVTTTLELAE
ncbi:hypothetical protein BH11MYX3_BH11MYX3_39340 [soil metagenome]